MRTFPEYSLLGNGPYELFIKAYKEFPYFPGMIVLFILSPFLKALRVIRNQDTGGCTFGSFSNPWRTVH